MIPDVIYAAPLLRTMQTARLAVQTIGLDSDISPLNAFVEIDYGVDENKTEEEVRLRLGHGNIEKGKKIIEDWDKNAVVPDGWKVDPDQIIHPELVEADLDKGKYSFLMIMDNRNGLSFKISRFGMRVCSQ